MQLKATLLALFCALMVLNFAVAYRPQITLALVVGGGWWAFAWLCRNYPTTAYLFLSFLRGLLGARR